MIASFGVSPRRRSWLARSRHSVATHEEALRLYCEVGPREAARRCGVSVRTIARWAAESGSEAPAGSAGRASAATEARKVAAARRRLDALASIYGLTADKIEGARHETEVTQWLAEIRQFAGGNHVAIWP
jgi:hypothetical protein